jgi:hypothetical protein
MDPAPAGPASAVSRSCWLGPLGGRARRRSFLWGSWTRRAPPRFLQAPVILVGPMLKLKVLLPRSSTVEVAASPPAVRLGTELAFQLHQAPDPGAVGAEVPLDLGGQLADGGQVDAEQLRAPRQRCRDRPAQVWVVPSPHSSRLSNKCSRSHRECYRPHRTDRWGTLGGTAHRSARVNSGQSG